MSQLFVVIVATVPEYYSFKQEHPEHDKNQIAWFKAQKEKGNLVCCGPFYPHDGTGLWILAAENKEQAQEIVNTSPRAQDNLLADETRIVEWQTTMGRDRLTDEPLDKPLTS
ncbi:MAG: YciI family protein [Cyanobacteria bacterium J06643_13]